MICSYSQNMNFKVPRDLNKMNAFTLQICIILLARFITLTFIANIDEKKEKAFIRNNN